MAAILLLRHSQGGNDMERNRNLNWLMLMSAYHLAYPQNSFYSLIVSHLGNWETMRGIFLQHFIDHIHEAAILLLSHSHGGTEMERNHSLHRLTLTLATCITWQTHTE